MGNDVPILLISAYNWSDIEGRAWEAGANSFISKPLFAPILYDKINELRGVHTDAAEAEEDNSDIVGMRIPVTENNDMNWEIICPILQMCGIDSKRAENNSIVVEQSGGGPRHPRTGGPSPADIPITAMTADAFSEGAAECLAAGTDRQIARFIDSQAGTQVTQKDQESTAAKKAHSPRKSFYQLEMVVMNLWVLVDK